MSLNKRGRGFSATPFFLLLYHSRSWTEQTACRRIFLFGIYPRYTHTAKTALRDVYGLTAYTPLLQGVHRPPLDVWWKGLPCGLGGSLR